MSRHPIQPLEADDKGMLRFKRNAIVCHLLDNGGIDMNKLAALPFSQEDREQFAQLIGYSHSGFGELSYVSDATYSAAARMHETGETDIEARLAVATELLRQTRDGLRKPIADLFGIHPDDLGNRN
jgi:hypothetical protein